ncbi:MAG: hypothetical protein IJU84_09420 [Clostridia bacterium]|nr:hypothetical protein [Clostridia bacterium]
MKNLRNALVCVIVFAFISAAGIRAETTFADSEEVTASIERLSPFFMVAPSIVADVETEEQLNAYRASKMEVCPATLILRIDSSLNVTDKDGNAVTMRDTLGNTYTGFHAIRANLKKRHMLVAVYLRGEEEEEALSSYLAENQEIYDLTVISADASLVKKARENNPYIRGAVDYSATADKADVRAITAESNLSKANCVILSQAQADKETCYRIQSMFKSVWVRAEGTEDYDYLKAVSTGAYGVITRSADVGALYDLNDRFDGNGRSFSLPHSFYNIGHRGCNSAPENTLKACRLAYEGGATHIEIDVKVSSDGKLFVFHDNDLSANTSASGNPENYTLEQLKNIDVIGFDKADAGNAKSFPEEQAEKIASLDDIFDYFKDKDDIIIICEIKTVNPKVVQLLGEKIEEYGMYGKVVSIAFALDMLGRMEENKLTARIPTAYLGTVADASLADRLKDLSSNNTASNVPLGTNLYRMGLKDRGFVYYAWTYNTEKAVQNAIKSGAVGITSNVTPSIGKYPRKITPAESYTLDETADISSAVFPAKVTCFDRTESIEECSVFAYRTNGDSAEVILQYTDPYGIYTLYSDAVTVEFLRNDEESSSAAASSESAEESGLNGNSAPGESAGKKGCKGGFGAEGLSVVFAAAIIAINKRREK